MTSINVTGDSNDTNLVLESASAAITEGSGPAGPAGTNGTNLTAKGFLSGFEAAMDAHLQSILVETGAPQIGLYVERNGEVYNKAFGVVELSGVDMNVPYTVDTPGAIASSGKMIAGIALQKAIDKGWITGHDQKLKELDPATFDKPFYELVGLDSSASALLVGPSDELITVTDASDNVHYCEKILCEDLTVEHGLCEAIGLDTNPKFSHPSGTLASDAMNNLLRDADGNMPSADMRFELTMDQFINVYWGSGYLMKKPSNYDYGEGTGTLWCAIWRYYNNVLHPELSANPASLETIMNELLADFGVRVYIFHNDANGNADSRLSTMKVVKPMNPSKADPVTGQDLYSTYKHVEHIGSNMYMSQTDYGKVLSVMLNGGVKNGVRVLSKRRSDEHTYKSFDQENGEFLFGGKKFGAFYNINKASADYEGNIIGYQGQNSRWGLSSYFEWGGARGTRNGFLPTENTCLFYSCFQNLSFGITMKGVLTIVTDNMA